jgi:hypothetical protein
MEPIYELEIDRIWQDYRRTGDLERFRLEIETHPWLSPERVFQWPLLHKDVRAAKALIELGLDVTREARDGCPLLHQAIELYAHNR